MTTIAERAGRWIAEFDFDDLPERVVDRLKVVVLHNLGVGLASHGRRVAPAALRAARTLCGAGGQGATSFVDGRRESLAAAVYGNSALLHYRTQEDTHWHAYTHFGPIIVPVALALAEARHRGGRDVLEAVLAGYQIGGALGSVGAPASTRRGFRGSSVYGGLGAAACAAKLLGLSAEESAAALALAANAAGGLNETWSAGSMEYSVQLAGVAVGGLLAALLAAEGVEAAPTSFEGTNGFFRAFGDPPDCVARFERGLAIRYQVDDVMLKAFSACALAQSPIEAMLRLLDRRPMEPAAIERIVVSMHPAEASYTGTAVTGPFRSYAATLMSVPFALAVAVRDRRVSLAAMHELDDGVLRALARRVEVVGDATLRPMGCRIAVHTDGGAVATESFSPGRQHFQFDFDRDVQVLRSIGSEMRLDEAGFDALVETVGRLDREPTVAPLIACMVAGAPQDGG